MPNNNEPITATVGSDIFQSSSTVTNSGNIRYQGQPFRVTDTINTWREMAEEARQQEIQRSGELPIDVMKQRHLDGNERMIFHNPKKDWVVTKNGTEICRSSTVLDVSDLIAGLV